MAKLKKSVDQMVTEAREHIVNHSPAEAKRRVDEEHALLVDIRDVRELQRDGTIAGALHAPRGMREFWIDPGAAACAPRAPSGTRRVGISQYLRRGSGRLCGLDDLALLEFTPALLERSTAARVL